MLIILIAIGFVVAVVAVVFAAVRLYIPWTPALLAMGVACGFLLAVWHAVRVLSGLGGGDTIRPDRLYLPPGRGRVRDFAWPHYLAGQVMLDGTAVVDRTMGDVRLLWRLLLKTAPRRLTRWFDEGAGRITAQVAGLLLGLLVAAALAGATVGAALGATFVLLAMGAVALAGWAGGILVAIPLNWRDVLVRRVRHASAFCPACHYSTDVPAFRCPGPVHVPAGAALHRDLRAGSSGLFRRTCGCGAHLPTTHLRAAAVLDAVCPLCETPLGRDAGMRTSVRVVVAGAAGAGKSRWAADASRDGGQSVLDGPCPLIRLAGRHRHGPADILLIDPPGDAVTDPRRHDEVRALHAAHAVVFVIDPFTLPKIARTLAGPQRAQVDPALGEGPARDGYDAIVQLLDSQAVPLSRLPMAVVVSKADLLRRHPVGRTLGADSAGIRDWLSDAGLAHLILAADREFGPVRYFAPEPGTQADGALPWLLSEFSVSLAPRSARPQEATRVR
ncbi:TRAFAC clade GTPase domain-containing protein [Hamadaea tsunoensis]|uniref:TRAFAC clade GTPase domain-containing protein n=1 Tax=Hamadaea tsunoensis TaxID=53368 RepID=UPI0004838991|nr:hypothetical protein [Hamadaea tsunoensis]